MENEAVNHKSVLIDEREGTYSSTWVPIEPVQPTMEMGLGPSQVLLPNSGIARPGHAGGGPDVDCTEQ